MNRLPQNVVFFDGICNLCNGAVLKLIQMDKHKVLSFASLQSEEAKQYIKDDLKNVDSIVYYVDGKLYSKSSAVLEILKTIRGGWQFAYILIIIPRFIRDAVYDLIARNRYKWFGKKDQCIIPTKELKARFL